MDETTGAKKTTRTKKTAAVQSTTTSQDVQSVISSPSVSQSSITQVFDDLTAKINTSKQEFDSLQIEIAQVKQDWVREQKQHDLELVQQRTQEELERKREQETYEYSTALIRKRNAIKPNPAGMMI